MREVSGTCSVYVVLIAFVLGNEHRLPGTDMKSVFTRTPLCKHMTRVLFGEWFQGGQWEGPRDTGLMFPTQERQKLASGMAFGLIFSSGSQGW